MTESDWDSDVEKRIEEHLDAIDRALAARGVTLSERRSVTEDVETQIRDMLAACNKGTPTLVDVEAVLSKLDPPDSYTDAPVARPVEKAPLATPSKQPSLICRFSLILGILLALVGAIFLAKGELGGLLAVGFAAAFLIGGFNQTLARICVIGGGLVLLFASVPLLAFWYFWAHPSPVPINVPAHLRPAAIVPFTAFTENNKATLRGYFASGEELRVFVGTEALGWSISSNDAAIIIATVEASSEIRLDDGSLASGFIIHGMDGRRDTMHYVAITPDGPVPFGELVFRTNEKITWEDGVYSFADIRKPDGTLVPLSAKIRKSMTPATR